MRCKCGNEIKVPEHLRDLATWICTKCANASPKQVEVIEDEGLMKRHKKAAKAA